MIFALNLTQEAKRTILGGGGSDGQEKVNTAFVDGVRTYALNDEVVEKIRDGSITSTIQTGPPSFRWDRSQHCAGCDSLTQARQTAAAHSMWRQASAVD